MKRIGILLLASGIVVVALAAGVFGDAAADESVPPYVLALAGVAICGAGGAAWFRNDPVLNNAFAAVFLAAFAWIGLYVAFFGDADRMSGGIPLLPRDANVGLGRILFGIGALITVSDATGRRQTREIQLGGGFMSFDAPRAHFGLGDEPEATDATIRWADGTETVIDGPLAVGRVYRVTRQ